MTFAVQHKRAHRINPLAATKPTETNDNVLLTTVITAYDNDIRIVQRLIINKLPKVEDLTNIK